LPPLINAGDSCKLFKSLEALREGLSPGTKYDGISRQHALALGNGSGMRKEDLYPPPAALGSRDGG
jgi:hypothetical protein